MMTRSDDYWLISHQLDEPIIVEGIDAVSESELKDIKRELMRGIVFHHYANHDLPEDEADVLYQKIDEKFV